MAIIFISTKKKQIDYYIYFCAGEQPVIKQPTYFKNPRKLAALTWY